MTVGDTATVTGGYGLEGKSVSFTLYSDSGCSSAVSGVTGSGTISGGTASYSTSWTPRRPARTTGRRATPATPTTKV